MPRIRAVPHVVGNFHTIVFISVPVCVEISRCARRASAVLSRLSDLTCSIGAATGMEPGSPFDDSEDDADDDDDDDDENDQILGRPKSGSGVSGSKATQVHLSLCKPMYMKRQFIKPFVERLEAALAKVKPFYVIFDREIAVYANESHTSFFAGIPVESNCRSRIIDPLIGIVDKVAETFGFEQYYEQRQSHVSLAVTGCDINLLLRKMYTYEFREEGMECSTHHWVLVERALELFEKSQAGSTLATKPEQHVPACSYNSQEAQKVPPNYEIEYTFSEELFNEETDDPEAGTNDSICAYVDQVKVLVGAQLTVIKLAP